MGGIAEASFPRMRRKSISRLSGDIGAYLTGRSEVPRDPPAGDNAYPIDWRYMLDDRRRYFAPFDKSGLPMKVFPGSTHRHYLPSRMASWALAHWTILQENGDDIGRQHFLQAADWFAAHDDGRYLHSYGMADLGVSSPWLSALAQGQAISVLTRAALLTGDDRYLDVAVRAAVPLITSCDEGGVVSSLGGSGPFLEEYPDRNGTLNGCLLAIVGIDDLIESGAGDHVVGHRHRLIETVADQAEAWERKGWSLYSHAPVGSGTVPNFNTMRYHCIHVLLLDHFAGRSGDYRLATAADRTAVAMDRVGDRLHALLMKGMYRLRTGW